MKRLMIAIAAAALGMFAYAGDSDTWTDTNGVTWSFDYTTSYGCRAYIKGASGYTTTLDIPAKVRVGYDEYTVTDIMDGAFSVLNDANAKNIKSVTIPNSVYDIGSEAFRGGKFTSLKVNGGTLRTIGSRAFYGCDKLASIVLPFTLELIGDYAFGNCTSLMFVEIGQHVSGITMDPYLAFSNTPYLERVNANDSFSNAIVLTGSAGSVSADNTISTTEPYEPVKTETHSLWWKWTAPAGVTMAAFHTYASAFDTIIGVYTGSEVYSLTEVACNDERWEGMNQSFASFPVTAGQTYYICVAGYGISQYGNIQLSWKAAKGFSFVEFDGLLIGFTGTCPASLTIPNTVTWIMESVFDASHDDSAMSIESVVVPESVVGIEDYAFHFCYGLSSVKFNRGLQELSDNAFLACLALAGKTIELPATMEDVTGYAFSDFDGTLKLKAPRSVESSLVSGSYGSEYPTDLTVEYYDEPSSGLVEVSLCIPSDASFGLGVPEFGSRTTITVKKGAKNWNNAISRKPRRPGYSFTGFWDAESGGTQVWDANMKYVGGTAYWNSDGTWNKYPPSSMNVYARWTELFRIVTFNANGGSVTPTSRAIPDMGTVGSLPTPTKSGQEFLGWFTAASGGVKIYSSTKVTADVTYYAHWKPKEYKLTFNANGGTCSQTYILADYCTPYGALPVPTRGGHDFQGWFTAKTGGTKVTSSTKCIGNLTVYAQWKVKQYKLTFNGNGGTASPAYALVDYCKTCDAFPTPTWSGHTFNGWYTARTGGTKVTAPWKCTGNKTIYAQWTVKQYKLTFNGNGGTVSPEYKMVDYCKTCDTFPTPTWGGHTFNGWYTAKTGGTKVTAPWKCTGNKTIYAQWTVKQYTITYNANGGTVSPASQKVNYCATYTLPTPTWSGHTFQGWYTAKTGGTKVTSPAKCTGNATLYARWK